ncbi:MAG: putative transporter protein [Proteobacteria bacterium]|nr:putative transporter protein [Pseudomonadota bacterium]
MIKNCQQISGYLRTPALIDLNGRALFAVGIASFAMNILLFAIPLYTLQVYDRVLTSRSGETLLYLTLLVLFALTASAVLDAIRNRLFLRIGNAYSLKLGARLIDLSIAQSARTSDPSSHVMRDMHTIRNFVTAPQGLGVLYDTPLVPLFLVTVYLMHTGLGHAMLLGVILLIALTLVTELLTGKAMRAASEASIEAQRRIDGVIQNAEAVEAMGMRAAMRNYWQSAQGQSLAEASLAGDRATIAGSVARWVRMLLSLMMTGAGAWFAIHDEITIGTMVAANILSARGLAPLEIMISAWRSTQNVRVSVDRINTAIAKYLRPEGATQLPEPRGEIAAENLVYVPPGAEQPTIKGIGFRLPAGSWLGLVGPSGAGKSSLVKLICGVWQPRSGVVRLDGADVFTWPRADFGRHCGYLPQDVELFAGTVRDNIARFLPPEEVSDSVVVEAAKIAGVHDLILRLPKGYDTLLGAGGASLSVGQRQRIGLARAFLGMPRLIVLDEPNSNLDTEGEQALVEAVRCARKAGSTIIMICHRPSLLADANFIGVLVDGQMQHFGPRDEVLRRIQPKPLHAIVTEGVHGNA